ncbi:hypothetical protein [Streptomyces sp. NPDC059278]|uniref:hypothetical protein n=1 Tax=Streptomyces sp. NPDC059278 TaxID=3346801 RepID=UPI0036B6735E
MARLSPNRLVIRAYYQSRGATLLNDPEYRPDDWRRPEFRESERAAHAREMVSQWIYDEPNLIRAIQEFAGAGHPRHKAGEAMASYLDLILYGSGGVNLSKDDQITAQLCADSIARRDFCMMDFGALMDDVAGLDLPEPNSMA